MAHWDDERDARWIQMARETTLSPEMKKCVDKFEETGDLIWWSAFIMEIRRLPSPQERLHDNATKPQLP